MAVAIPLRSGARSRSEGALTAALYRDHAGELLRFAWHRLGRLEDAEDAVQATFLSAHRVLQEGERVREPRAWLFRILRNECLTRIAMTKRRGVHEELGEWHADSRASVADQMESNDEFDVAVALLATLPEQQREAMVLREWLGMSAIETAAVLDVTPQGVDALVYRARKSLVGLGDVDEDSSCGEVRQALADAKVNNRVRAHLLKCRSCRSAARRLHAPEEMAVANGLLPLDSIASRLGDSIPGFAVAGGAIVAAGGGAAAAGIAGSIAAGTAAKVVATVAVGAVVATGVAREAPAIRNALAPASNVQQLQTAPAAKPPTTADGAKRVSAPQAASASGASDQPAKAAAPIVAASAVASAPADAPPADVAAAPAAAAPAAPAPAAAEAPTPAVSGDAEAKPPAAPAAPAPSGEAKPPVVPTAPAPATGSKPPAAPVVVPAPATKPPVVSQPQSDGAKRAAEAAAEQAKKQAEQAKKAAEVAAEQAKKQAEQAKKQAEQAKKAAEAAAEQAKRQAEAAAELAKKAVKPATPKSESAPSQTPAVTAPPAAVAPPAATVPPAAETSKAPGREKDTDRDRRENRDR